MTCSENKVLSATEGELGYCDGCGAHVPLNQLSLVTYPDFPLHECFCCEECKRETVVVALSSHLEREQPAERPMSQILREGGQ